MSSLSARFHAPAATHPRGHFRAGALVLLAAAFAIYWPALHGQWLWDDVSEVTLNPTLRTTHGLWQIWFAPPGPDYFPLKSTVQWLEWHLWADEPTGYHAVSILCHGASAILLWRLFAAVRLPYAWLGGLLFCVHPLAVESVAWVAEQKNTLSLPLVLGSLLAFTAFARQPTRGTYACSVVLFVLSLLTKTSAVGVPFVLAAFTLLVGGRIRGRELGYLAPFFAASLVLGLVTTWFQSHVAIASAALPIGPLSERITVAAHALLFYTHQSLLPTQLMAAYPGFDGPQWLAVGIGLWLLVAGFVALAWAFRATGAFVGIIFYLAALGPILGIIPLSWARISPVSDHFAYLGLVAVIGFVLAGFGWLVRHLSPRVRPAVPAFLVVTCVTLSLGSRRLAAHYRSADRFWAAATQANPASYVAHYNYGNALRLLRRNGDAAREFTAAIRANPSFALARSNLADLHLAQKRYAEAANEYRNALVLDPTLAPTQLKLAQAYAAQGRYEEASRVDRAAVRLDAKNPQAAYEAGFNLLQAGHAPQEALSFIRQAVALDPTDAQSLSTLGMVEAQTGDLPAALAHCRQAVRLDPGNARFHNNLGNCLLGADQPEAAAQEYVSALQLDPRLAEARTNLELARRRRER